MLKFWSRNTIVFGQIFIRKYGLKVIYDGNKAKYYSVQGDQLPKRVLTKIFISLIMVTAAIFIILLTRIHIKRINEEKEV